MYIYIYIYSMPSAQRSDPWPPGRPRPPGRRTAASRR